MKYLSVCSGIEAATVAWHPLGWEPVAFSEVNPFASAVLAHHWPHVPNLGDMTKHENWPIEPGSIDLLVGGTPCQSFSVAGLRRGLADPRGNLALVYLAILDRLRPRWCVWENVPGVLSSSGGRDFGSFLGALAQLGYGFAYRVLDAQYVRVDGYERAVPQRRRRVFVVGCAGSDWQRAARVLLEPSSVRGDSASSRKARKEIATGVNFGFASGDSDRVAPTLRQRRPGEAGFATDVDSVVIGWRASDQANAETLFDAAGTLNCNEGQRGGLIWPVVSSSFYPEVSEVCGTIADGAHYGGGANGQDAYTGRIIPVVSHTLKAEGFDASEDGTGRGVPLVPERFIPAVSDPITAHEIKTYTHEGKSFRLRNCVTDVGVRRLTPRECERLQGFPDDHTLVPYRGKEAMDGPRYRAIGNSMAVNVMRWIGRRIEQVEGKR